jgi:nitronate monooxygenase
MGLSSSFTRLFGIEYPIVLAPMGGSAGGALAAAVSNGGGLGLVGGGRQERDWLDVELAILDTGTDKPWGVGFQAWALSMETLEAALDHRPRAVMLSFGDPRPFADAIRGGGAALIVQVTDLDEAEIALDAGADVVVAQGAEAGGHGGRRGTLSLVPAVVDLAGPTPVLAAGGIGDGRGLAAALTLGAGGVLLGTRFQATLEALVPSSTTKAILEARGDDTERSGVLDISLGSPWPRRYSARTIRNPFVDRWRGKEEQLAADPVEAHRLYEQAVAEGELPAVPLWAGEGVDLITDLPSAADLIGVLASQAERALEKAARSLGPRSAGHTA